MNEPSAFIRALEENARRDMAQIDALAARIVELEAKLAEAERVTEENNELQQLFDLRWKADMRAIKQWQKLTGRKQTWPDHADLCVFLMMALDIAGQRAETAEAALKEAREDAELKR